MACSEPSGPLVRLIKRTAVQTESELIERCRGGDQDAFRVLVQAHHDRVYRTAYAMTSSRDDASEIVQETFVKAWRGLERFRGDASLATWLTRLSLNTAKDHLRRARARHEANRVTWSPVAEGESLSIEDRDELQRAVRRLPQSCRRVVALHYGLDLSLKEVSELMRCPEGTIKSRLNSALIKLREIMQSDGVGSTSRALSRRRSS